MQVPEDVAEARSYLERAEKEGNPEHKLTLLREGIELLDLYEEDFPENADDLRTYITNIRRSQTRNLLSQLVERESLEIEVWLSYVVLLITRLKAERQYLMENDPDLKNKYDRFWSMHSDTLKEALKEL